MSVVITNVGRLYTMAPSERQRAQGDALGVHLDAEVHLMGDKITYAGPQRNAPAMTATRVINAHGGAVLPGLVDCHTHTLFAGTRAEEYALRSAGKSYADIMAAGGGILNTVKAVRKASEPALVALAADRIRNMLRRGVTCVEVKSGYGLSVEDELKSLRAIAKLADETGIHIEATCLAAHAVPPEFEGRADAYVDLVCNEIIPQVAEEKLARFCDVFVEQGAFSVEQARRVLVCAKDHGLLVRVHAEQLSHSGGAKLAAELGATACGHLEFATADDFAALKAAGVVVEVLSGAQVFLGMKQRIDGAAMVAAGLEVAIGTDYNPGSSPIAHLPLCAGLAMSMSGIPYETALRGITLGGAKALARDDIGHLSVGAIADLLVLDTDDAIPLLYDWAEDRVRTVIAQGRVVVGDIR